jgi:GEVED domain/Secretion system C-terminal sorting domain
MLRNNYYSIITIVLIVFCTRFGVAQTTPTLVKNLNPEAHSSTPRDFYSVNNQLYFTADDEEGEKIFRTDGSEDGTIPITYTPPAGMVFRKATVLNGQWYVLLLETPSTSTEHAQKVVLARTDFASTNVIQTLSTCKYPIFKDFSAKNGKLVIQYSYLTGSFGTARSQSFFVHNGNSNGILMSKEAPATTTYATFANENTFFVEETFKANPANAQNSNQKTLFALNNGVATSVYNESWAANAPTPFDLFTTVGVATDKIHVSIKDALVNFSAAGVRTHLKNGVDVILYAKTAGETMYFVNNRRELWKTDGSVANTTKLNTVFESPNEVIINLLGGGASVYVVTQGGNTTRTYYIKPQGGLTKVNTGEGVTYFQPFVSKGLQYVLANKATSVPTCSIPSLIRYGKTQAQTQSFELWDKTVELCDNSMTSPTYSLLMDNNLFYYGMQTLVFGNELWKLQLAPAIADNTDPNPTNWCDSKSNMPWELYISNVNVGTIANASGKFKEIGTLGYSNFANLSTALVKGQNYPLSVTPTLSWAGNLPNVYCNVWIDFNKNNVFETNELVLEKGNQNPFTQTFTVPADAVLGSTRMRVSLKFGSAPTACDAFEKGEVEDYTIQITDVVQPPVSSGKVKSNDLGVEIYPNPAADKAIIDLKNFVDKHITLAISDLAGKVLVTQTIENVNVTTYLLPIQTLQSGTYFVTVQAAGEQSVTSQLQIVK